MLTGAVLFAFVFGRLGMQNHRNFGTWSFDMGIYDQAFWLVSRGKSWITVRGIDMWGHHTNLIAFAYAPFYWLGAGPSFLYVSQAIALGAGAIPVYLIACDRLKSNWIAAFFALAYLMYAPIQWIAWANFHPEALVITPMLFAWWFATRRNWGWCFGAVAVALSTREDAALAIFMMGLVLLATMWRRADATRHDRYMAIVVSAIGVVWYLVCMRLVIPHFNRGQQPFYIDYFYGNYGSSTTEIVGEMLKRPDRVVSDATQPDRLRFYRDLLLPWGGLPLGGPLQLTMALPQMLASVIGLSPYARMIRYQYTAIMIAPIVIAAIEGGALALRYRIRAVGAAAVARGVHVREQRRLVAVAAQPGELRRGVGAAELASRAHPPGDEAGPRRRVGHGDVRDPPAPVASRADLRLAQPVEDGVLRQRRRLPPARPERDRVHHPRPPQRG